jgi:lipopolysaccharide transport system ATP-binding protein
MSLHTVSNTKTTFDDSIPVIELSDVAVRYRAAQERIPSFKEYAIRWLRRQIRYEEFWALQNISLSVKPGEVLGIIGPNGAGKSTLLKVVARVLRPTRGRVQIRGRISPLLELGAGFDPELTGRENVYLNSAILGYSKLNIDKRFDRIVDFAGLHDFIDAPVRTYSTGMAARLGFAVATDVRPEILIVDEILGVGDAEFQTKSFERIQSFQAEGTTILLVSHSLDRIQEMCSRAIWLDHGQLMLAGTAENVVGRYLEMTSATEEERLAKASEQTDDEKESRWGSYRAEIKAVRFTDENGKPKSIFQTGQTLVLNIEYVFHEDIKAPVFGMAIHRNDGVHVTGPNTGQVGIKRNISKGSGAISYTIPNLSLLEGLYHVSVAIVNEDDTEMFDFHDRSYPFRVANMGSDCQEIFGLATMQGHWRFEDRDLEA